MAVNITEGQAQEMRDDPNYKGKTEACPLCDPEVIVEPGISMPHVCQKCGNVWQPMQVLSAHPTCILPDGAISPDKLLQAFGKKAEEVSTLGNMAEENLAWVGWACKLLRQYGLQDEDYDSYSDGQLRDAISEIIQHYVT